MYSHFFIAPPNFFFYSVTLGSLHFVLFIYFWVWDHPLECDPITRSHVLEENWLSIHKKSPTTHSFSVRGGAHEPLFHSVVEGSILCRQPQLWVRECCGPLGARRHFLSLFIVPLLYPEPSIIPILRPLETFENLQTLYLWETFNNSISQVRRDVTKTHFDLRRVFS